MRRNIKILSLYAVATLLIITVAIYKIPENGNIHQLVTDARWYFSSPNNADQEQRDKSNTTAKDNNNNASAEATEEERLTVIIPGGNDRTAVDDPSFINGDSYLQRSSGDSHPPLPGGDSGDVSPQRRVGDSNPQSVWASSPENSDGEPSIHDNFKVVPLGDAAPAVQVREMPKEFYHTDEGVDLRNSTWKKILIWNEGYGTKTMGFGFGRKPFQLAKCETDTCFVTGNRTLIPSKDFDAILFHFRATTPRDMPNFRYYNQRWIFEEVESSSYIYQDISVYNNIFNWTMTYRRDSDIVYTYGRVVAKKNEDVILKENYATGKSKMAAWFVSNCRSHSRREKFVKALQKYFRVDIYGKCGPYKCPHKNGNRCYKLLEDNYKFYLSFENSICKDYVTEKLFNILKYNVVPVVYGAADYDAIAPPGSYVNALKFPDVKTLAKYLNYLDGNDTAYNEYFRWKGHYTVDSGWSNTAQPFCELCKKLHQDDSPKVYKDMKDWFVSKGACKTLKTKDWLSSLM